MARWFPWRKKDTQPEEEIPSPAESQQRDEFETSLESERGARSETLVDFEGKGGSETRPYDTVQTKPTVWRRGLSRLRHVLVTPLDRLFVGQPLSEEVFPALEEVLLRADIGVQTTTKLIDRLRERSRREWPSDADALKTYLKEEMLAVLQRLSNPPLLGETKPWVILVVGVNGVGKTTTIAKLAARFSQEQKNVLLVAADTFRAAAIEQLDVWATRLGLAIVKHQSGASPAAVAFDGVRAATARQSDVVIIDTAGRLHTKAPLMEELKKVHRVIAKELPGAPHEILLVLDASTGQNALSQARTFQQALPLTGVILTKMDGSAKGGMALAVVEQLEIPLRCLGLGERPEDLQDFSAKEFVEALFAPIGNDVSLDTETEA